MGEVIAVKNLNNNTSRDGPLLTHDVPSVRDRVKPPDVIPNKPGPLEFSLPYSGRDLHINHQII